MINKHKYLSIFISLFILFVVGSFVKEAILIPLFPLQGTIPPEIINSDSYNNKQEYGIFHGKTAYSYQVAYPTNAQRVLGMTNTEKRIEVDLTNQRLYAFEGDSQIYDFPISSGLYDWTPRGEFRIWIKLKYVRMRGGNQALGTYYDLPNVPYTMFFANDQIPSWRGFGIHGTYWHNNFGQPMSHGCVNLRTPDAEQLYYWATPVLGEKGSIRSTAENPGTKVIIYGKYIYK